MSAKITGQYAGLTLVHPDGCYAHWRCPNGCAIFYSKTDHAILLVEHDMDAVSALAEVKPGSKDFTLPALPLLA